MITGSPIPDDVRSNALKDVREGFLSTVDIAEKYNISPSSVRKWWAQERADRGNVIAAKMQALHLADEGYSYVEIAKRITESIMPVDRNIIMKWDCSRKQEKKHKPNKISALLGKWGVPKGDKS